MKKGKDLQSFFTEVQRQAQTKADYVAPTEQLTMTVEQPQVDMDAIIAETEQRREAQAQADPTINLEISGQGAFQLRDTAHSQLATWAGVPIKYYRKMQEEAPQLLADNVNTWLHRSNARRMVRTLDGYGRAFLSDRYRVIDHLDVMQAMMPVLSEVGLTNADVVSAEITERKLYFKALFPKIQGEIQRGDVVQAGLVITNSEIGQGSVDVWPLIYRLACLNGMIRQDYGLKKYHVGRLVGEGRDAQRFYKDDTLLADDRTFLLKMRDVITAAAQESTFAAMIEDMRETTERKVQDPAGAIQVVTKQFNLNEDDQAGVLRHFIEGGDISQWGVANALTRYSQDVDDYDKATELERAGGQIVELAPSAWQTIETAKAA